MAKLRATVCTLAVVTVLGAGCGSGVEPRGWAKSVCVALAPWRTRIADLTSGAQQQITGGSTPAAVKQTLLGLLAGARDASETARRQVASAGTPDVDHGAAVESSFVATLAGARDAYAHAYTSVSTLDTGDRAFYDRLRDAFATLDSEYKVSALDTGKVGSTELRKAFTEVPECR